LKDVKKKSGLEYRNGAVVGQQQGDAGDRGTDVKTLLNGDLLSGLAPPG